MGGGRMRAKRTFSRNFAQCVNSPRAHRCATYVSFCDRATPLSPRGGGGLFDSMLPTCCTLSTHSGRHWSNDTDLTEDTWVPAPRSLAIVPRPRRRGSRDGN